MQTQEKKTGWADNPATRQKIRYALYAICALLVIADLVVERHIYQPLEEMPAFYAFYGFGALVAVVQLAKLLRRFVGRGEDYYKKDEDNAA